MGIFTATKELDSLQDLFFDQVKDLYDAELRLTKVLPRMAEAAFNPALKAAFFTHFRETDEQINRLERVFEYAELAPEAETCQAMKGLIEEAESVIHASGSREVKDAALIAAAQRIEHYEMAGYGCARTFATRLGMVAAARLLQQSLDEEQAADKALTALAEASINPIANRI